MSRFNLSTDSTVINHEGMKAYELSPEFRLYSHVCNSLLADQYYRDADKGASELETLVKSCNPDFVANLAAYARNEMHLRSVPIYLATLLNLRPDKPRSLARQTYRRVIQRADEITEALGCFAALNKNVGSKTVGAHTVKKTLAKRPAQLVRAIKDVFEEGRFDRYQYAKYNRDGAIKLKDALFLARPKPRDTSMAETFQKIANDGLEAPYTWEVEMSRLGQEFKGQELIDAKQAKWAELVISKRLGHMALLRNLRNILELSPGPEFVDVLCGQLVTGAAHGKQFPFRYWSAYKSLSDIGEPFTKGKVIGALNDCLRMSTQRFPQLQGNVLIACDTSGSMDTALTPKASIQRSEVGLVLGMAMAAASPHSVTAAFADHLGLMRSSGNPIADIEHALEKRGALGHGTNGWIVLDWMLRQNIPVDNLVMFTDCQLYGGPFEQLWLKYKQKNLKAKLWLFDLAGYGNTPVKIQHGAHLICGWSDRIFEVVDRIQKGQDAIKMILDYSGPNKAVSTQETTQDIDSGDAA
jgi:60 kDa SS-A/Ro ribonucleoprotein